MILEICVDNYESLRTAVQNGADRIELCASLREGGLTPPVSFIEAALKIHVPVFVMIRPRSCDFLYTSDEIEMMHRDIYHAKRLGAPGVVFGVLTEAGEIDVDAMKALVRAASGMAITCHRAVDQVRDIFEALDTLTLLGVDRVLSSGQAATPVEGVDTLREMVVYARKRIGILAAGVRPHTVREIIEKTGVDEVHSSASIWRPSPMKYTRPAVQMGQGEDYLLKVVKGETVRALKEEMRLRPNGFSDAV